MIVQSKVKLENEIGGKITAADLAKSLRATFNIPPGARVRFFVEVDEAGTHDIDEDLQIGFTATWDANLGPARSAELQRWLDSFGQQPTASRAVDSSLERIGRGSIRAAVDEGLLRAGDQNEPLTANRDGQR